MKSKVRLSSIYAPSDDVVAREVQGEFILIPLTSHVGAADEIFTLNECGRAIWDKLDSKRTLKQVAECLSLEFDASYGEVEKDVLGWTEELLKKKILLKI